MSKVHIIPHSQVNVTLGLHPELNQNHVGKEALHSIKGCRLNNLTQVPVQLATSVGSETHRRDVLWCALSVTDFKVQRFDASAGPETHCLVCC